LAISVSTLVAVSLSSIAIVFMYFFLSNKKSLHGEGVNLIANSPSRAVHYPHTGLFSLRLAPPVDGRTTEFGGRCLRSDRAN
jgi:hypothetical protein